MTIKMFLYTIFWNIYLYPIKVKLDTKTAKKYDTLFTFPICKIKLQEE